MTPFDLLLTYTWPLLFLIVIAMCLVSVRFLSWLMRLWGRK